jgi:hypothetical protein
MVALREKEWEGKNAAFPLKSYVNIYSFGLSTWNLNMDYILDDCIEFMLNFLVMVMVLWL